MFNLSCARLQGPKRSGGSIYLHTSLSCASSDYTLHTSLSALLPALVVRELDGHRLEDYPLLVDAVRLGAGHKVAPSRALLLIAELCAEMLKICPHSVSDRSVTAESAQIHVKLYVKSRRPDSLYSKFT